MPVQSLSKIICHYLSCTILYVQDAFDGDFGTSSVNTFVTGIIMPQAYPHIAVYYPSHAKFEAYDVIVIKNHFLERESKIFHMYH